MIVESSLEQPQFLFEDGTSFEGNTSLLAPASWIEENSLPFTVGVGDVSSELREMFNQGIKPCDIRVLRSGR